MSDEDQKKEKKKSTTVRGPLTSLSQPAISSFERWEPLTNIGSDWLKLYSTQTGINFDWLEKYRAMSSIPALNIPPYWFQNPANPEMVTLEDQINKLKHEINKKQIELSSAKSTAGNQESQFKQLNKKYVELLDKQSLTHILNHVGEKGGRKVFKDPKFRVQFQNGTPCKAFVLSIDIRRSTELMLKSRDSKLFAQFITALAANLRQTVLDNFGVFDKFTGDGILAIFPEFYSGEDAGYRVVNTAINCHKIFKTIYEVNRKCFMAVLKDAGLGIGIDYGDVQIVEIGGEFTVVGTPVVYACRMSGAPAYQTLVNQPGYEQLFEKYSAFDFEESEIDIKHEGMTIAYKVSQNGKSYTPSNPSWLEQEEEKPS